MATELITKRNYDFCEVASAFQKAIRRGDGRMAGYWALELYGSNFRKFVWERLHIMASEGLPGPLTQEIVALHRSHDFVSKGVKKDDPRAEGRLMVVKATLLLAAANKCRDADHLICPVNEDNTIPAETLLADLDAAKHIKEEIPDYALDGIHTRRFVGPRPMTLDEFIKTEFEALTPRVPGILDDPVYNRPPSNPVPKVRPKAKQVRVFELE
jgi:hypothetical protein